MAHWAAGLAPRNLHRIFWGPLTGEAALWGLEHVNEATEVVDAGVVLPGRTGCIGGGWPRT